MRQVNRQPSIEAQRECNHQQAPPNQGRERGAPISVNISAIQSIGNGMVVGARPVCLALEGWYSYCHQVRKSAEFIFQRLSSFSWIGGLKWKELIDAQY